MKRFILVCCLLPLYTQAQKDPHNYHEHTHAIQHQEAQKLLDIWVVQGDEHILDFGCHTGKLSCYLASRAPEGSVLGVDHNADMISFANEQTHHQNLMFQQSDPTALSYENAFDLVTSFAYLHWLKPTEQQTALRTIARGLKPGGKALFRLGISDAVGRTVPLHCHVDAVSQKKEWQRYLNSMPQQWYYPFAPSTINSLLQEADLKALIVRVITREAVFDNEQAFADWAKTWLPHMAYLPKGLHDSFALKLAQRYCATAPRNKHGQYILERPALEVVAEKPAK